MRALLALLLSGCLGPTHMDAARDIASEACSRARGCGTAPPDCERFVVTALCSPTDDPTAGPVDPHAECPPGEADPDALARCLGWTDARVCGGASGSWADDCLRAVGR